MVLSARRLFTVVGLSLAVAFLLAACTAGGSPCGSWDMPLPVSQDLAHKLEQKVQREILSQPGRPFRLEITQEEITSYLALNIHDYPIERPEIRFSQGLVHLSGTVVALGPLRAGFAASFLPQVSDGLVALHVKEACLLGFSLPQFLRSPIARVLNDSIADAKPYILVHQLEISEGKIVLVGEMIQS